MTDRFTDRVAIVTGAASGIGAATARRLVTEGAQVVLADIADAEGRALAAELGDAASYLHVDVSRGGDWERLAGEVMSRHGGVDVLHANGPGRVAPTVPIHDLAQADWDRQVGVSLTSAYHAARLFCPLLARRRGALVLTSSVHANTGVTGCAPYAAAKGALLSLTRQLAVEYAPDVRVNAVIPGPVLTPAWDGIDDNGRAATVAETPAGRFGDPGEVAAAVAFLASGDASFITGVGLVVDGGWSISTSSS
jgi:NAD(P)-dependent dehydrogenase (short-subunit alcohol dehydrogenase family)